MLLLPAYITHAHTHTHVNFFPLLISYITHKYTHVKQANTDTMLSLLHRTQGDQYDVREKEGGRDVRNLGKPVELAARYFEDGADEVR